MYFDRLNSWWVPGIWSGVLIRQKLISTRRGDTAAFTTTWIFSDVLTMAHTACSRPDLCKPKLKCTWNKINRTLRMRWPRASARMMYVLIQLCICVRYKMHWSDAMALSCHNLIWFNMILVRNKKKRGHLFSLVAWLMSCVFYVFYIFEFTFLGVRHPGRLAWLAGCFTCFPHVLFAKSMRGSGILKNL